MRKRKYTDEQFINAVRNNTSIKKVLEELKLIPTGGSYKLFYIRAKKFNLDLSHFTGQAHLKGKSHNWTAKKSLNEILVENSTYCSSNHLRKRLIKEGVFDYKCSSCQLDTWMNKPIRLELDHINGNNMDNRLENLRILCPNCHSLTPTFRRSKSSIK